MGDFDSRFVFKEWESYDLAEDLKIDKSMLDEIAENHSAIMQKWLDLLVQAQAELSKAKEVLQNVEAELFLKAKTGDVPELPKATDATVKAWGLTQDVYRRAARRKRKAENNVAYLQNARSILEHRKAMIKTDADLWICGYFARPLVNGEVKNAIAEQHKEKQAAQLKESLKKRRLRQKNEDDDEE